MKYISKNQIIKSFKLFSITALAGSAALSSSFVFAVPPHLPDLVTGGNRWTITFYNDSTTGHSQYATQGLCFYGAGVVGTHQRYIWVSDTYPDWNGRATQEGDQIFMHGDFQWPFGVSNGGHDGMTWEISTNRDGAGHWKEWVEDFGFGFNIGFGNARLTRVGTCNRVGFEAAESALKAGYNIERPRTFNGEFFTSPMGVPADPSNAELKK